MGLSSGNPGNLKTSVATLAIPHDIHANNKRPWAKSTERWFVKPQTTTAIYPIIPVMDTPDTNRREAKPD